ncbi:MAG: peptidase M22 [Opitutaceae bacterium]|jgi:tRNA threonylcarbamoyladenosine biosynthesis protein TsaB
MPSLRDILTAHRTLLLIDACSERVQAAIIQRDGEIHWESAQEEAGTGVFSCIDKLGDRVSTVDGYVFCEGPGSILGIRTSAAAIRVWRLLNPKPVWAFRSLDLLANSVADKRISVISDARRDSWHVARSGEKMKRVPTGELSKEEILATPENFRRWSKLPDSVSPILLNYDLATLLPLVWNADLFHPSQAPDAFLHEEPSYATWSPQIHRAST